MCFYHVCSNVDNCIWPALRIGVMAPCHFTSGWINAPFFSLTINSVKLLSVDDVRMYATIERTTAFRPACPLVSFFFTVVVKVIQSNYRGARCLERVIVVIRIWIILYIRLFTQKLPARWQNLGGWIHHCFCKLHDSGQISGVVNIGTSIGRHMFQQGIWRYLKRIDNAHGRFSKWSWW